MRVIVYLDPPKFVALEAHTDHPIDRAFYTISLTIQLQFPFYDQQIRAFQGPRTNPPLTLLYQNPCRSRVLICPISRLCDHHPLGRLFHQSFRFANRKTAGDNFLRQLRWMIRCDQRSRMPSRQLTRHQISLNIIWQIQQPQ